MLPSQPGPRAWLDAQKGTCVPGPDTDIQADRVGKTTCPQCRQVLDLSGADPFTIVQCPHCKVKFTAPGKLGSFVLFKALGKGEMGATYRALEKGLGRFVAIKVMRKALGEDKQRVDGFFAEARAVASLEHPNAVRLYSVGQEKGQPYIVMELIKGKAMDKAFSRSAPMAEDRALEIAIGMARALAAAAEIGLVHGDVKPANIMLDEKGTAKLVDFGIAKFGQAGAGEGDILGTPYYVAPEAVRKEPVDFRADMYSLGATLFHALTGTPPFPGTSADVVLNARLQREAPGLLTVRGDLHPRTAAVVARMLQSDPQRRHATYRDLLDDLQKAYFQVTGLEVPELQAVVGRPDIPMAAPVKTSPAWILGGAGAGAALLLAVVWALWLRGGDPPAPPPTPPPVAVRRVERPTFSPPARSIAAPTAVRVLCATPQADIRYTIDGTEPSERSPAYQTPLYLEPGTTLRARAYRQGYEPSGPAEALYGRDSTVLADVVPVRTAAEKAWQRAAKFDPHQGFGPKLEAGDTLAITAKELYRQGAYQAAKESYEKLLALCGQLETLDGRRKAAAALRDRVAAARRTLEQAGVKASPDAPWRRGDQDARRAFDEGRFDEARRQWQGASAQQAVALTRLTDKARGDWRGALARADTKALDAHGGRPWKEARDAAEKAGRAERDKKPGEAIAAYRQATDRLARAVDEARRGTTTAQRKDRLARARALAGRGEYNKALAEVQAILADQPRDRTAGDLKKQIQARLVLTVDFGRNRKMHFRWVPAGTFTMGSPETELGHLTNEHSHSVCISRPFYIGKVEVRRKEWRAFRDERRYRSQAEEDKWALCLNRGKWVRTRDRKWDNPGFDQNDDHPVTCVTWKDAEAFCRWLGGKIKRTVRLPTEAEWEYACRAGAAGRFAFGEKDEDLPKHGNYADASAVRIIRADKKHDDGQETTAKSGSYAPNKWDLRDMHGNVGEWCADYFGAYDTGEVTDPKGPARGKWRVVRGGAWDKLPAACRSAARWRLPEDYRAGNVGFRVVVELK